MRRRIPYRTRFWITLTVVAGLLALAVPVAVGATGIFPNFPAPDDLPEGVEPVATGQEVTITSGETSGLNWQLTANESDTGLCVNLEFPDSSGGGCGFGLIGEPNSPGDASLSVMEETDFSSRVTFIHGPTTPEVERVTLVLDNGELLNLPTKPGPPELGSNFNFFVATVPDIAFVATAVAKDTQGVTVDRIELPPPSDNILNGLPKPAPGHSHEHLH